MTEREMATIFPGRGFCADENATAVTPAEIAILEHVAEAWRLWCGLPDRHPDDVAEFHAAVHQMQLLVAYRAACRAAPHVFGWPSSGDPSNLRRRETMP